VPAVAVAVRVLGFEPRHVEDIAQGLEPVLSGDGRETGGEFCHIGGRSYGVSHLVRVASSAT
jgi:hypothetical protein